MTVSNHSDAALPSERKFGLTVGTILLAIALYRSYFGSPLPAVGYAAGILGGCLVLLALVRPAFLRSANAGWMKLGLLIGRITNPVIMAIIFALAVTPYALVGRLVGRDELRLKIDRAGKSYWEQVPPGTGNTGMDRQF